MILFIIRMKVLSEKRIELSQTIALLSVSIRKEKGCRRFDFCQNVEKENQLYLLQEWESRKNLINHMKSDHFSVLRGAMNLLQEPYEMIVHNMSHLRDWRKFYGEIAFTELPSS
jgi:quinol monooxygenase YgiN